MKAKDIIFINNLANTRIQEKINSYKNNKIIINYLLKNNIKELQGLTINKLEEKNKRYKEYIKTALCLNDKEFYNYINNIKEVLN